MALDLTYTPEPDETGDSLDLTYTPTVSPEKAKPKKSSAIRGIADVGLGFASGAVGATKAIADVAGAGNAVSGILEGANKGITGLLSDSAKADQQEQSRIVQEAEGKGTWEGIKAGAKAFAVAPVQTAVTGLGSVVPIVAGTAATALTGGGAPAALAAGAGLGAAMGAGTVKGAIFDEVKERGIKSGMSEADAIAAATKAQEYSGDNTGNIAIGAGLGIADAATGVTKVASNIVRNAIVKPAVTEAAKATSRGLLARTAAGIAGEMPLEAAQGGQEKYAANVAAQRAGYEADPWAGVAAQATLEALASAGPGAAFGAFNGSKYAESKRPSNEKPAEDPPQIAGLLPAPTYTGTPGDQIIANDTERQAAIDAADRNAAELYAARDEFEQKLRRAVTITNEPAPLQERIDEMLRVDTSKLSGIERTNYEKALTAAFNEPIGIRHDKDQREVPFTIGEYLDAQVALEDAVRNREKSGRAVAESGARLQQLAEEEVTQQPDIPAPIRGIMPAIPVVGPLSKAANTAVQAGITTVQQGSAGILAPAPVAQQPAASPQPATSPLTAAATMVATPSATAKPSAAVPGAQTATAPVSEASNPATPLPETGAPGAEVQQQAQPVVPVATEKTAPAAKGNPASVSNPPAVPAQTEQTAPASASTVAQPAAGSADDTYRPLIEALIKNKRNAKQLGFDIEGALQKSKDAMHGKKQMPGAFRKLADKAEKLGDTETASILRQIADLNDARKSPKKADPVADQNPIKSEAPAVTESVSEKAPVDQQAAEEKQSATNPDGKEGADLSWAEVLDEAWNNGFETGNADFVPQKQHLEQAYQRTFTDAQVEEYTATYQRGARESDEKASPPEGSKEYSGESFDSDSWDKKREDRIKASKQSGAIHLDDVPASVESMRGKEIFYVHNPKQRGVIRTVDNRGNVYVYWSDKYSADKEMATEVVEENKVWLRSSSKLPFMRMERGGKTYVFQSSLGTSDLKDYVFADAKSRIDTAANEAATSPTNDTPQPSESKPDTASKWSEGTNGFTGHKSYTFQPESGAYWATVQTSEQPNSYTISYRKGDQIIETEELGGAIGGMKFHVASRVRDFAAAEKAQHIENGKTETATPSVIAASVQKSAAKTEFNPKEALSWLLGKVDEAIAEAPTAKEKGVWDNVNQAVKLDGMMNLEEAIGFKVFDVPGDGRFKVLNLKERLQAFRDNVEKSPGFRKPITPRSQVTPAWQQTGRSGTESTIRELLEDGDLTAAYEFAKQIGKPMVFGDGRDGPIVYTDARQFELDGFDDFPMVSARTFTGNSDTWAVIHPDSGLAIVSGEKTRAKAESETRKRVSALRPDSRDVMKQKMGAAKGAQESLADRWLSTAVEIEKQAQEKAEAENRKGRLSHQNMSNWKRGEEAETQAQQKPSDHPPSQAAVMEFDELLAKANMATYRGLANNKLRDEYRAGFYLGFDGKPFPEAAIKSRAMDDGFQLGVRRADPVKRDENGNVIGIAAKPSVSATEQKIAESLDAAKIKAGYAHRAIGGLGSKVEMERKWFADALKKIRDYLSPFARNDQQKAELEYSLAKFADDYKERRYGVLEVGSSVVSSAVAGRNNFNSTQAGRRGSALDRAEADFNSWLEARPEAIKAELMRLRTNEERQADADSAEEKRIKKVVSAIASDLATAGAIDQGKMPGMERASFLAGAVRKIENLHKAGDTESLRRVFAQIRQYNDTNKKPLFSERHSVWKFEPEPVNAEVADEVQEESAPAIPEGYKKVTEYYRDGQLIDGYAPFAEGERVRLKSGGGNAGVVESFVGAGPAFPRAMVRFDNGSTIGVSWSEVEAEPKAETKQERHFRNVDALNPLTAPVEDGDWFRIGGQEWQARNGYTGRGWSLIDADKKTHPTINNIEANSDLIREIVAADGAVEAAAEKELRTFSEGSTDGMKSPLAVTYILRDKSDSFFEKLRGFDSPQAKFDYLQKAKGDLQIPMEIGKSKRFGDQVDLNRALRDGKQFAHFSLAPRRGYVLATLTIDLAGAVAKQPTPVAQETSAAKEDPAPEAKPAETKPASLADQHASNMGKLRDGTLSVEELKAAFALVRDNRAAIEEELSKRKKDELLRAGGMMFASQYKSDTKPEIVKGLYARMLDDFIMGSSISYALGGGTDWVNTKMKAIQARVDAATPEKLAEYAASIQKARDERKQASEQVKQAIADPKTLDDFRMYLRAKLSEGMTMQDARLSLTPEQRIQYDTLEAEASRKNRVERKEAAATDVRAAAKITDGQVIETKHTKTGEPLFVVKAGERVDREIYNEWNANAKRLGGWYSSFRGNGAVPGFQFKTRENADAFLQYLGGNTVAAKEVIAERRDAFADDRSQSAVERLTEMADRLDERADEALFYDRKTNTARRARFAASAEAAANADKALAQTMRNIAKAIADGTAKFLDRVRQKTQVEMLRSVIHSAKYDELKAKYPSYADQERHKGEPATAETADYAKWPTFSAYRSDLAKLARELMQIDGAKQLGQKLLKVADDVTAEYQKFAKENLHKVSTFKTQDGKPAVFPTADRAEAAISRSGFKGKATTISFKRGEHLVIMGPEMAREAGLWHGDDDKRITLTAEAGEEIVAKNKAFGKRNRLSMPYLFDNASADLARWKALGIETPAEMRSALREFIGLREIAKAPDKIKEMERAMIGRKNDGLDFFPTPAETAQAMIDAAELKEGMAVLEPSAGMGHIAEQIREAGFEPDVVEFNGDRRELLELKGFQIAGNDFMELSPRGFTYGDVFRDKDGIEGIMRGSNGLGGNRVGFIPLGKDARQSEWRNRDELEGVRKNGSNSGYDRILMNPPFSNRRDAEHVRHAYSLLKPGGRIVAIMGEGVFFGQDKKAQDFRAWLEEVGGTSEKLEEGTFLDPSLPVNTATNARMVVIDKPEGATSDNEGVGSRANRKDSISPSDKAIYGMAAEGKSSTEILKFIAASSRNPFYRQLAKLLLKTGIAPKIMIGDGKGWKMNAGEGHKYAAAYNPKTDTVALFRPGAAERNMLHELVHAATIKALEKGGLSAAQMRALYQHVKKTGKLHGMYGMTDVDEFVSEAFTNPKFQEALKKVMAPQAGGKLTSAWQWFVRVVRGILGLPANDESALSAALEIGLGVMREDMQIRRGESGVPFSEITGKEIERTLGRTLQEKATNWMRLNLQGKSFENDATGWDIAVGRKGINKAMSHGARDVHARSVAAIPDLLKHAILVASEPNNKTVDRMDIAAVHHFYAPFRMGGEVYIARMVVKETRGGQRFYDYDTSDVIRPTNQGADAHLPKEGAASRSAGREMSMANLLSHVKAEHGGTDPRFKIRHNVAEFFRGMGIEAGASGKTIESIRSDVQLVAGRDEKTGFPTWKGAHVSLSSPRDVTESHDVFYRPIGGERAVKYDIRSANGQIVGHTVLEIDGDWPTILLDIEVQKQHRGNRYAEKAVAGIVADAGEIGIWHIVPSARSWWERIGTQTVDAHNGTLAFNDYADARASREDTQSLGEDVGRVRYNVADDGAWEVAEPSKMDDVLYALQDKHIDTKRVVQAIIGAGKKIRDAFNPYLQEELFHGRAAKGVKDFLDFELRPLLKDMQSAGVEMGDFEEYLWNRHAEERNRQVAKVNPDMKDGGSGIKTADARAYLAGLPSETKAKYEQLAKRIDAISRSSQGILVSSGLETQETIDAWNGAYQHYVPLQREDVDSGHVGTGKGFSVRGSATKRAMGSGRKVVDIIGNLTMQRERNIVRAEKNRVSNALLGLAVQNPNPEFWQVDQAPKERVVEEKAIYTVKDAEGNETEFTRMADAEKFARSLPDADIEQTWGDRVTERVIPGFSTRDNVILTRINGQDHYVVFNERNDRAMRMAQSLKNLDTDNLGRVLSVVGKATRYLASINTQYNPVFGVINLIRDAQGSLLNLSSTPLAGEQKRVLGYTVDALRGIYADIRAHRAGKVPSSNWAKLFEEFQKEGGQTGYRDQYANAEDRAEAVRSELAQFKEGKAKQMVRGLFGWLSDYNETMENAVRLAAYKAATEKGMSKQQAASLAKNITVNFNRKGQMATQVGALYAFFNASVQGTARIAETLFDKNEGNIKAAKLSKTGKKIIAGGIMLGSMQALLLAAAGFDDDEPPEFVRERNLVMPIGDGKYLTLAMPLGFHVLPGIGRIATEFVLSGGKDPAKKAASFVSMFAEAFNPVGNAGFSLQTITPSVVDPFAALAENKDFTGREIYRENMNSLNPQPGHARAKDVATVWSRYISEALNYITGGSEFRPGVVSVSPDALDYLVSQAFGGVGREANKIAQTYSATTSGEDLPLYKIPLAGRFIGDTEGQSGQSQKFYEAVRTLNGHENEIKGLLKQGRREEATAYREENPESSLIMAGNHVETVVRKLRAQKRDLISKEADKEQVRAIDDRITAAMRNFNERYRRATEAAS